ncbi:16707_t:CDS:1, partial [Gigaspora margarita]
MTSQQEEKTKLGTGRPNKYIISYEPLGSKFFGSLINYNTLLVASKKDFVIISQKTYRGSK